MFGTTGTPGHIAAVTRCSGPITSGTSGEGGEGTAESVTDTVMESFATTRRIASTTAAARSSGRRRQLTMARAVWGRALSAWPASTRVATQVVRSWALKKGDAAARRAAAAA